MAAPLRPQEPTPVSSPFSSDQLKVDPRKKTLHFTDLGKTTQYDLKILGRIHKAAQQTGVSAEVVNRRSSELKGWESVFKRKWIAVKVKEGDVEHYTRVKAKDAREKLGISDEEYKKHIAEKGYDFTDLIQEKLTQKETQMGDDCFRKSQATDNFSQKIVFSKEAVEWYEKAFTQATPKAQNDIRQKLQIARSELANVHYQLALANEKEDPRLAAEHLDDAARLNHADALEKKGESCFKESQATDDFSKKIAFSKEAVEWYETAFTQATPKAQETIKQKLANAYYQLALALAHEKGDPRLAAEQLAKAAKLGLNEALDLLGSLTGPSVGKEESFKKEFRGWSRYHFGKMHEEGQGVEKNLGAAIDFYQAAENLGCNEAGYRLGNLSEQGHSLAGGVPIVVYERPAQRGYAPAQNRLGELHLTEQQIQKAVSLFQQAALQGNQDAVKNLMKLAVNENEKEGQIFARDALKNLPQAITESWDKHSDGEALKRLQAFMQEAQKPDKEVEERRLQQFIHFTLGELSADSSEAIRHYMAAAQQLEHKIVGSPLDGIPMKLGDPLIRGLIDVERRAIGKENEGLFGDGELLAQLVEWHIRRGDISSAEKCLKKAEEKKGCGKAADALAKHFKTTDSNKEIMYYEQAALDNYPGAQESIKSARESDIESQLTRAKKDLTQPPIKKETLALLQKIASNEHASPQVAKEAHEILGDLYLKGRGVKKNEEIAFEHFYLAFNNRSIIPYIEMQKIVDRGYLNPDFVQQMFDPLLRNLIETFSAVDASELYRLGKSYLHGEKGIRQNLGLAIKFFEAAASKGDLQAIINLQSYADEGFSQAQSILEAMFKQQKGFIAPEGNWADNLYQLGQLYRDGSGIVLNREKALICFQRAAEQGNKDALSELERMANEGSIRAKIALGDIGRKHNQIEKAEKYYKEAFTFDYDLKEQQDAAQGLVALGTEDALTFLKGKANEKHTIARYVLATHHLTENPGEAITLFQQVEETTRESQNEVLKEVWKASIAALGSLYYNKAQSSQDLEKEGFLNDLRDVTTAAVQAKIISPKDLQERVGAICNSVLDWETNADLQSIAKAVNDDEVSKAGNGGDVRWLFRLAQLGNGKAEIELETLARQRNEPARDSLIEHYKQAAARGDSIALHKLHRLAKKGGKRAREGLEFVYLKLGDREMAKAETLVENGGNLQKINNCLNIAGLYYKKAAELPTGDSPGKVSKKGAAYVKLGAVYREKAEYSESQEVKQKTLQKAFQAFSQAVKYKDASAHLYLSDLHLSKDWITDNVSDEDRTVRAINELQLAAKSDDRAVKANAYYELWEHYQRGVREESQDPNKLISTPFFDGLESSVINMISLLEIDEFLDVNQDVLGFMYMEIADKCLRRAQENGHPQAAAKLKP